MENDKITFKKTQKSFVSDEEYTTSATGVTKARCRFIRTPAQWAVFRGDELVAEIRGRNSTYNSSWYVLAPGTPLISRHPHPITGSESASPFKSAKAAKAWAVKHLSGRLLVEILKPDIETESGTPLSVKREGIKRILDAGPEFATIPRSLIWESETYRDLGEIVSELVSEEAVRTLTPEQIKIMKELKRSGWLEECDAEDAAKEMNAYWKPEIPITKDDILKSMDAAHEKEKKEGRGRRFADKTCGGPLPGDDDWPEP